MTSSINRRTLVKGAAWAAPVVATTAVVPAYAASTCAATGTSTSSTAFGWSGQGQTLQIGSRVDLQGLPADVTVESITLQTWVQARTENDAAGVNVPMWNANQESSAGGLGVSDRATQNAAELAWTPATGTGFLNTASSSTSVPATHTFGNGTTALAWEITQTWSATADSKSVNRYSNDSVSSCRNFSTGDSGTWQTSWNSVKTASTSTVEVSYLAETTWTATLSNKWVLKGSTIITDKGNYSTPTSLTK